MDTIQPAQELSCVICGNSAVGQCENCNKKYCIEHGNKFCSECINQSLSTTPTSVIVIMLIFYGLALFFSITMIGAIESFRGVDDLIVGLLTFSIFIIILFLPGYYLSKGSNLVRWMILVPSYISLFFFPIGTIIGRIIIYTLGSQQTSNWFDIQQMKQKGKLQEIKLK